MTRLAERAKGDKDAGDKQSTQTAGADKQKFFVLRYLTRNKTLPDSGYGQATEIWPTREEVDARVEKLKTYDGTRAFEVTERGHE